MKKTMELSKEEEEKIMKERKENELKRAEAEFITQYDNCYCYDEYGNWKWR